MTRRYAEQTEVSVDRSRAEIERILQRYGASAFQYGWTNEPPQSVIQFVANNRIIRFVLPMPREEEFKSTEKGKPRSKSVATKAWEQACRQRWRALTLAIKAKLEAVEIGISEFEEEFLAFIVDPNTNEIVGDIIRPQLSGEVSGPLMLGVSQRK